MAVTHVQYLGSVHNEAAGQTTTVIGSLSATVTSGNTIIVGWGCYSTGKSISGVADNLGNTYVLGEDGGTVANANAEMWYAPVTVGGTLTTITITHTSTQYLVAVASEFAGVGTKAAVGNGTTGAGTAATWSVGTTIPANGFAVGMTCASNNYTHTAGAASGSPSTTPVLSHYINGNPGIDGSLVYALAGGSSVTSYTGNTTLAGSCTWATAGGQFNPAAGGGGGSSSSQTPSYLEVSVWDGATPTTELAILDGAASVRWTDLLGDVGSGSCELSFYDPKATAQNTTKGNLIKFSLAGSPVFGFFNMAPVLTIGEANSSKWTLAGDGVLSYLKRAVVYPTGGVAAPTGATRSWTAATFGGILKTLIDEAQARSTIPSMTYDFTATLDSVAASWTANVNLTIDCGATLLDVAKKLVALGMGLYMDPNLVLHAYLPGTQGTNLTSMVIWRLGAHLRTPVTNTGSMPTTVCLVKGAGGVFVEASDAGYTANSYFGRIESGLDYSSVSSDSTQMTAAGNQQIALSETVSQAIAVSLTHGLQSSGQYEPYIDYRPGDVIALDVPGSFTAAPFQIAGVTIAQTPDGGYTVDANLGSISLPIELQVKQLVASVSGSSSSFGGSITGNLTLTNPKGGVTLIPNVAYSVTADVNNLAPAPGPFVRLNGNASAHNITGMVAGYVGEVRVISNDRVGSGGVLTLKYNSASSSTGNKFAGNSGADKALAYQQCCTVVYDGGYWIIVG